MEKRNVQMFWPFVSQESRDLVQQVLSSRWIGEGQQVKDFEQALKERFGFLYPVALNSGTAALELALALAEVGPGDEVVTVAQTCTATNMPILRAGAKPVFADVQYLTGNIDPNDIEHRITSKTKAIMVVHWAGLPCDLDKIHWVARGMWGEKLPVIEDAAHALGAMYHGRPIGTISPYTCYSFQAIKQLTTGDGGCLAVTQHDAWEAACRRRWFGIDRDHRTLLDNGYSFSDQHEAGYKMQMTNVAAAIGLGNLTHWPEIRSRRRDIVGRYREALKDMAGITLLRNCDDRVSGNWLFTMHAERRDAFCLAMRARGVEASIVHIRNDRHSLFAPLRDDLPNTARWNETAISLPLHNHLTDDDVGYVLDCIGQGW
jgi:perosamine synthetase